MPARGTADQRRSAVVLARLASVLRRISGMPDYPSYAEHQARYHRGMPMLTEREFYDEYLKARYGDGPTRCC
jgi:uncharacterized short protein YbdD (DUF466 family)